MNVSKDILFRARDCQAHRLNSEDRDALQALLERDYLQLVCEPSTWPSAAQSLLSQLPEGVGHDQKFVIGIYGDSGDLIGVLDVIQDCPDLNEWTLGLMLLEPHWRNQGLGTQLYRAFEQWAAQLGAQHIRLGVLEYNEKAYYFWRRMGFMVIEKKPFLGLDSSESLTVVMRRSLTT